MTRSNTVRTSDDVSSGSERAVSPVIGVILMVAITVILAAVIGVFVLGLGEDLQGSAAPTLAAQFNADSDYNVSDDATRQEAFHISHTSGNSIVAENLRVVVRDSDGAEYAAFEDGTWTDNTLNGTDASLELGGGEPADDDEFGSGATITIWAESGGGDTAFEEQEYTINLVHTPSGTTVAEGEVDL